MHNPSQSAVFLGLLVGSLTMAAERFEFVIPGDDNLPSATDFSGLNAAPAGDDGFVRIRDGHFCTDSGRLRIWGVNTCFGGNFPTHEDAERVAAHLAKLGINGVRMHHHDGREAPRGVWAADVVDGHRHFDPTQLDRQDYFLDQLHRRGIYANLNLHVSRTFTEAEGFLSKDLPRSVRYNKYLLYYEPRMRQRFKDFCRDYLLHENPYRQRRRVDDPGIAMVEITNENAFSTKGPGIAAGLPEPYRGEFKSQWNDWLKRHYATSAALRAAWQGDNEPVGGDLADMGDFGKGLGSWSLHAPDDHPVTPRFGRPGPDGKPTAVELDIASAADSSFHHELMLHKLSLTDGRLYTLSFWVRAAAPRTLYADVSNQGPKHWHSVGFAEHLSLGPEWQQVTRVFRASNTLPGNSRICFKFGGSAVNLFLAGVRLQRGGELVVLPDGQSVESGNVEIPLTGWADQAQRDCRAFMVAVETGFIREIMAFLKDELGVRAPITASQITYHGAGIVAATCDYADIHGYWQHPRFPGKPWDGGNWFVPNTPMVKAPGKDTLTSRAVWRLLDRPFTMSEWNIPQPNDYAASVVPFAAAVGAVQDWDGIFFFQYHSNSEDWFHDHISSYFSFNGQPVKLAMLGAWALAFRRGDLPPLKDVLAGSLDQRQPAALAFRHLLGIDPNAATPMTSPAEAPTGKRLATPDEAVVWDARDAATARVIVNTPSTRAAWGLIGGRSLQLGDVTLELGEVERNYASVILVTLDGLSVAESRHLLLAAVGSAENVGMGWNEDRTSVGRAWGKGPAQVNGVPLVLKIPGGQRQVHVLDGRGKRLGTVPTTLEKGLLRVPCGPEFRTLWYELVSD